MSVKDCTAKRDNAACSGQQAGRCGECKAILCAAHVITCAVCKKVLCQKHAHLFVAGAAVGAWCAEHERATRSGAP